MDGSFLRCWRQLSLATGEAAEGREGAEESPVRQAHQRVAEAILPVFSVCLAPEVEVMAQSLLALSRRASSEHLSSLGESLGRNGQTWTSFLTEYIETMGAKHKPSPRPSRHTMTSLPHPLSIQKDPEDLSHQSRTFTSPLLEAFGSCSWSRSARRCGKPTTSTPVASSAWAPSWRRRPGRGACVCCNLGG